MKSTLAPQSLKFGWRGRGALSQSYTSLRNIGTVENGDDLPAGTGVVGTECGSADSISDTVGRSPRHSGGVICTGEHVGEVAAFGSG